jgi:hypothetical protein
VATAALVTSRPALISGRNVHSVITVSQRAL